MELRTLELQRLSGELLRVQDEERRRIARTLHDDLGQVLTALKIDLDVHQQSPNAIELAQSALSKVRNISCLLHPPLLDESGLIPALHWYFESLQKRGELCISFEYRPVSFPRLPNDIETALFRIIQESLTNVFRHSESKEARIDITQEADAVTVRVRDFGKGMPDSKLGIAGIAGVGTSGMKERIKQLNGQFRISRAEPGTVVVATIPIVSFPSKGE